MNDRRVLEIRSALEALIESIDAVTRIARWGKNDPVPESLVAAASGIEASLKLANELAQCNITGNSVVVHRLTESINAIRRLVAAYGEFQNKDCTTPQESQDALFALDGATDGAREILVGLD